MGEGEVIQFLEEQEVPLTSGEIAKAMEESPTKISRILKQLIKFHEVKFVEINRLEAMARCGARRRIYLYFV